MDSIELIKEYNNQSPGADYLIARRPRNRLFAITSAAEAFNEHFLTKSNARVIDGCRHSTFNAPFCLVIDNPSEVCVRIAFKLLQAASLKMIHCYYYSGKGDIVANAYLPKSYIKAVREIDLSKVVDVKKTVMSKESWFGSIPLYAINEGPFYGKYTPDIYVTAETLKTISQLKEQL